MCQDRLDRLEKLAEEMFAGIIQLRESQAKADEQLNRTDAQLRKTICVMQQKTPLRAFAVQYSVPMSHNNKTKTVLSVKSVPNKLTKLPASPVSMNGY